MTKVLNEKNAFLTDENAVSLVIDGRIVTAPGGETVLEAARRNGIHIPSLCADPRLKPTGRCGICLVKIEGESDLRRACETAVAEGMTIVTESPEIFEARKAVLDALLSNHNAYCEPPCRYACPAGIDIPAYVGKIAEGDDAEAVEIIKDRLPLPRIIGRVCPRPCESACRRSQVDGEAVAICQLKRFAGDRAACEEAIAGEPEKPAMGRSVAVVGSGPSGLTAAYFLNRFGYRITIFEGNDEPGGMLMTALPPYRLPKDVVREEIGSILKPGIQLRTNSRLGRDFTLSDLLKNHDAVYLAIGAQKGSVGGIEGADCSGVLTAIDFLVRVNRGEWRSALGKTLVFGGGFTAIDAARSAIRLGASEVTIVYRRTRDEMPAMGQEVEEAEREGVRFHFLTSPLSIESKAGKVTGVLCRKMRLGPPDESGRRSPESIEGSEFVLEADTVILAIGQVVDAEGVEGALELNRNGTIKADPVSLATSVSGVFAGGDCRTGPSTAVEAIAEGRRAAIAIDAYLKGRDPGEACRDPLNGLELEKPVFFPIGAMPRSRQKRQAMPELAFERRRSFSEVELGFSEEQARAEAERCLQCICHAAGACELRRLSIRYGAGSLAYRGDRAEFEVLNANPVLNLDRKRCIKCHNCVRVCEEVQAIGVYSVDSDEYPALSAGSYEEAGCEFCGQCLSTCPTGAIKNLSDRGALRTDLRKRTRTVCPYCGCGCSIELLTEGDRVVCVSAPIGKGVNGGNLFSKGRFGFSFINHPDRLKTPLVRKNGELKPASWEEAIRAAASGLKRAIESHGADAVGGLASAKCTNEENYLFQKFMRVAVGTNNVDHCARL